MKKKLISKLYIRIYLKYCELTHRRFLKHYIVIYKYRNKIGYYIDAVGLNKKDVIQKVRVLAYYSGFFNEIKNINDIKKIQVIAIKIGE